MAAGSEQELVRQVQRFPGGDAQLLADQVQPGGLLGDGVLDLKPGVDLEEGQRPEGASRNSTVPALTYPAARQTAAADCSSRIRCSGVRNGAGASSTSFW